MLSDNNTLIKAAESLRQAYHDKQALEPLHNQFDAQDIETGYSIQNINTDYWLQQGRKLSGRKVGLTAKAVQKQLSVNQPDFGMLFTDMSYVDNEPIDFSKLIQPKIEGEIAFVLKNDLDQENLTIVELLNAIDYALPAIEIVDSRIANWDIKIIDTIADNASSVLYVLGTSPVALNQFDLNLCGMVIEHKGDPISVGAGAACLGNPLYSTLWLARTMVEVNRPLLAGDVVLSGALGAMVNITEPGVFELRISNLGKVRACFE